MSNQSELEAFASHVGTAIADLPVSPGMQLGPRTAYTSSGTKTVATETNWIPPAGWALWGFKVVAIGAGGGSSSSPGSGGNRIPLTVSFEAMGSPSTVVITVGAGVNAANGGTSSFGNWVIAEGGKHGGNVPLHPMENPNSQTKEGIGGEPYPTTSSLNGANSITGLRGGGGGAYNLSTMSSGGYGGFSFPRVEPTSVSNDSSISKTTTPYRNNTSAGKQDGVGDWCGDGGAGLYSGPGQVGFFPGGGAGSSGDYSHQRGGHGVVIVYPIFKKAVV